MRIGLLELAGAALLVTFTGAIASAQVVFEQGGQILYAGRPSDSDVVKVASWGGGIAKVNSAEGTKTIEITPKGFYQGGRLDFSTPVDLADALHNPNTYIQFTVRIGSPEKTEKWAVGLMPGMTGMPGMMGLPGMGAKGEKGIKPLKRMQVILFLDSGESLECQSDLNCYKLSEDGWLTVSYPFSALVGKRQVSGAKLQRIVLTADGTQPFNIGDIRIVHDSSPLSADAGGDKEVARNYSVVFQATATSGASAVHYSWDFDDSDGIQEEAVGDLISHKFRKAGDFVVTLTVSDVFGIKQPAVSTVKVRVNE
jgi:hypothetical protein